MTTASKDRLFLAIPLPPTLKHLMRLIQEDLTAALPPKTIRWQRPDNAHLTLFFLGDISASQQTAVTQALTPTPPIPPFHLHLTQLGGFPNLQHPRVIWLGLAPNDHLQTLHHHLCTTLAPLGFHPDYPTYTPHLTLGRRHRHGRPRHLKAIPPAIKKQTLPPLPPIPVNQFHLYLSHQAQYTPLATYPLAPPTLETPLPYHL